MYYYERLIEVANKVLNVYLLKNIVCNQVFQQHLFTIKITQISSSTIVLSQVSSLQSLFSFLHYINVWITHIKGERNKSILFVLNLFCQVEIITSKFLQISFTFKFILCSKNISNLTVFFFEKMCSCCFNDVFVLK